MEKESILGQYAKYTSLNVIGMIGLSCYILADTFFISKGLGANGLAALNLAIPVYNFINGTGLMMGMGGATRYSILKGQNEEEKANRYFTTCVKSTILIALLFSLAGIFLSGFITTLLGANEQVFDMTNTYLKVILIFAPMFMMNNVLLCFMRNDGNPRLAMIAMLTGSFSNIILDYIFIFPFGMGIFGAVLATGFAPIISMGILSTSILRGKNSFRLTKTSGSLKKLRDIMSLGLSSLVSELSSGIVIIVFNFIILGLMGNTGVAAYGVIANISLVVVSMFTGIAQGIQPIVSSRFGVGDWKNVQKVFRYAFFSVLGVSVVVYACICLFAGDIAMIFNSENDRVLQETAVYGLRIYFLAGPFAGFNIITAVYFSSIDRPLPSQVISLMRGFFVILPITFLLSALFDMTGVWLSFPAAELLTALFAVFCHLRIRKRLFAEMSVKNTAFAGGQGK